MHEKLNCVFTNFDDEREVFFLHRFEKAKWFSHTQSRGDLACLN